MFRTAARLIASFAVACTFAACEAPEETTGSESAAAALTVVDCDGASHTVVRLDETLVDGVRTFDLEVDGEALSLSVSHAEGLDLFEVAAADRTLALVEVSPETGARLMAADGRVFVSEDAQGFPEVVTEAVDARAMVALHPDVLTSLDEASGEGELGVARQALAIFNNTGVCSGVTCSSRDGNESCCCKQKCVRSDTTCYCTSSSGYTGGSFGGGVIY